MAGRIGSFCGAGEDASNGRGTPRARGDRPIDSNAGDILRRTDREPRNREKPTETVGYDGTEGETRWRLPLVARESASSRERITYKP